MPLINENKLTKWQRRFLGLAVFGLLLIPAVYLALIGDGYTIGYNGIRVSWFGYITTGLILVLAVLQLVGVYDVFRGRPPEYPDDRKARRGRPTPRRRKGRDDGYTPL
jgi:hypothetical protein